MSKLAHAIRLSLMVMTLASVATAVAQSVDADERVPAVAASQSAIAVEPSAGDLVAFLRSHPELTSDIKRLLVDRVEEEGQAIQPGAISDDALYTRIEQDGAMRTRLVQWLQDRGYYEIAPKSKPAETAPNVKLAAVAPRAHTDVRPPSGQRTKPPTSDEDPNHAHVARRETPYPGLASATDLYAQVPTQNSRLQRFGSDIFRNGTGNAENLPVDLPAGPDYVLGSGDGLNIDIWGGVSQRITRTVDREGRISLPEAGTVVVSGMTLAQAREYIQRVLTPQFRDVKVDVSLTRVRTVRIYVVGDVQRPGAYDISSLSTPLNALYAAGGPTASGSLRTVRHYRNDKLIRTLDLYDFLLHGVRSDVEHLQPGDTILVPPVAAQVAIGGMVRRPAIYELRDEKQLSEVIGLAGGVLVSATLREVKVERIVAHQERVLLSMALPDGADPSAVAKALGAFEVKDGDRITIASILPYSQKTVYLEGHVARPGKLPYREGLQISDVIRSYQDLLPEPASHAEIIRLVPPDYRPATIEVNLDEVLGGSDPITLQPFDTIRVFGRYEFDAPRVTVTGEVLRPGEYPLTNAMTAAGLVRAAGGFKRSAFRDEAELATYAVKDGKKLLVDQRHIAISKALDGESAADVALQPGDQLSIRQISGWEDMGASVTLGGEVVYPGKYAIRDREHLSSVLKRAGGLRPDAYAAGALLERNEVRHVAERTRTELIRRIESSLVVANVSGGKDEQAATMQAMQQQQQQILSNLRSRPASGRVSINITNDVGRWENTSADLELRAGDTLVIPKRPGYVMVGGQVYNPSAIVYTPGKNAGWYLHRAGGATEFANRKDVFVIRSNGSVVGGKSDQWFGGGILSTRMEPGDSVVVPEKIISGSSAWKQLLGTAQFMSSIAVTALAVGSL